MLPELYLLSTTNVSPVLPPKIAAQAQRHIQNNEEEAVIALLSSYAANTPFHGDLWHVLGRYYEEAHAYEEAQTAYTKAVACGNRWLGVPEYHLARVLMAQGRGEEAISWLERSLCLSLRALKELQEDRIWDELRSNTRFLALLPPALVDEGERITNWRMDLRYLARRMEQAHYDLFGRETSLTRAA